MGSYGTGSLTTKSINLAAGIYLILTTFYHTPGYSYYEGAIIKSGSRTSTRCTFTPSLTVDSHNGTSYVVATSNVTVAIRYYMNTAGDGRVTVVAIRLK